MENIEKDPPLQIFCFALPLEAYYPWVTYLCLSLDLVTPQLSFRPLML